MSAGSCRKHHARPVCPGTTVALLTLGVGKAVIEIGTDGCTKKLSKMLRELNLCTHELHIPRQKARPTDSYERRQESSGSRVSK